LEFNNFADNLKKFIATNNGIQITMEDMAMEGLIDKISEMNKNSWAKDKHTKKMYDPIQNSRPNRQMFPNLDSTDLKFVPDLRRSQVCRSPATTLQTGHTKSITQSQIFHFILPQINQKKHTLVPAFLLPPNRHISGTQA